MDQKIISEYEIVPSGHHIRRHWNQIRGIKYVDGQWLTEEEAIRQELVHFFISRWMMLLGGGSAFQSPPPRKMVPKQENKYLTSAVVANEV